MKNKGMMRGGGIENWVTTTKDDITLLYIVFATTQISAYIAKLCKLLQS